jgi:phage gpG-like protein
MPFVIDARGLFAKIGILKREVAPPHPYLAVMQQALVAWVARNFRSQGRDQSPPWKPMSENTRAARRGGGVGAQLLQDRGHLRASFAPGAADSASKIDAASMTVTVGSNVKYAQFHERGSGPYVIRPKSGKFLRFPTAGGMRFAREVNHPGIPQRRMLPTPAVAKKTALAALQAAVRRAVAKVKAAGR